MAYSFECFWVGLVNKTGVQVLKNLYVFQTYDVEAKNSTLVPEPALNLNSVGPILFKDCHLNK